MKNKSNIKRLCALALAAALCLVSVPVTSSAASPKLSKKSVTVKVGNKATITLKNAKKATWSIKSGKKFISITKKTAKKAVIKGKKAGTAKLCAKVGKKSLYCTIKVKEAKVNKDPEPVPVVKDGTERAVGNFAVDLLKELRKNDKSNTLISPDSIMTVLVMAGYGANGSTKESLETGMGVKSIEECGDFLGTLHKRLAQSPESYYRAADSIWSDKNEVVLLDSFVQKNKEKLDSDVFEEDFTDPATLDNLNGWVNKKTKKMIPNILDKLEKDDVMVLLNAVCFEGSWMEQYIDIQVDKNGTFTNSDGTKKTVNMLKGEEYSYIELEGGTGFVKPYSDGDFAFLALLPKEGESVDTYLGKLTGDKIMDAYENRQFTDVKTRMPEFTYDYKAELVDALKARGMGIAFTNNADFSQMADYSKMSFDGMHISRVVHKTHIELDKNGTKAAAATAATIAKNTSVREKEYKYVYLDRPFVYAIIDTATGMPLFLGTLDNK